MAFEIVKTFVVRSSPEQVWSFLTDPEKVARCLPGAAITGKIDEKTWQGTMTVKVGPVSSSYKGKVAFEKLDTTAHTAEILATGQDVRGRGGAYLRLKSSLATKGPSENEVTYNSGVTTQGPRRNSDAITLSDRPDAMSASTCDCRGVRRSRCTEPSTRRYAPDACVASSASTRSSSGEKALGRYEAR